MSDTPAPGPEDDITDEELAAALALIKKRRADAARQQEQTQPQAPPAPQVWGEATIKKGIASQGPEGTVQNTAGNLELPPPKIGGPGGPSLSPLPRPNAATFKAQQGTTGLVALLPEDLPAPVVGTCPSCKRKLLTRTSMLCNWCGAKIDNPDYQEQAARTRQEMDAAVRDAAATRVQESTERGLLNRLKRRVKPGDGSGKATGT